MLWKLPKVADCCVSGAVQESISNSCRLSNVKMGKCVFNPKWTRTYSWVMKHEDKHLVKCKICNKDIALGKMGEAALQSHEKSDSHRKFSESDASQVSMDKFTDPHPSPPSSTTKTTNPSTSGLEKFVSKTDVLKADVKWTIQTVVNHNSYKSNETVGPLFKAMFPDSKIAEKFTCGERKTAYFTVLYFRMALNLLCMSLKRP